MTHSNETKTLTWKSGLDRKVDALIFSLLTLSGRGKGNPSATYVVDADSMDNVAAIHGRIDPDLYGEVLTYVGYLYNIALIAPEVENTGHAVLAALNRLNYPNIYQRYQLTPEGWMQTQQLGWSTNMKSKPQMVAVGRKLFNQLGPVQNRLLRK